MNKMFGKVLAGAIALAVVACSNQADAFHHRWHGSSGGSSGYYGGSSGGSSGWYGGSSGGWGSSGGSSGYYGSSGGSSGGGWGHHKGWRSYGSSGSWGGSSGGSSGGYSGSWGSSGGSSGGGAYYYSPMNVIDPSTLPPGSAPIPPGGAAPVVPAPGTAPAPGAAPVPGAVPPVPGTSTGLNKADGLLAVNVPEDAKIFVNGQPTSSTGAARQYVSRDLANGYNYAYEVRAEVVRDGKTVEQVKTVNVRAGETANLAFDFPAGAAAAETSLTVYVPADAKVFLAGNATKAGGETRVFRTTGLSGSKSWEGYTIRVELERGGRVLTKEETISLKAGESREIRFEFEGDKVASSR